MNAAGQEAEILERIHGEDCPYAENPPYNALTLAAMREARDIMSGKIKVAWNHPPAVKEDLQDELREMLEV